MTTVVSALPTDGSGPDRRASLRLVGWLAGSWLVLVLVGVVMLRMPDALRARNPVSLARALFTSVNVAACCGFAQEFARPDDFQWPVRAMFVLQTMAGGLLSLAGGGVLLARWLGRPYGDGRITAVALLLLGGGLFVGPLTGIRTPGAAAFGGLSAVACSGIGFGDEPRAGALGFTLVLVPLGVVGSLGVVVVCDVIEFFRRRVPLPSHAARVLTLTAVLYLAGTAAVAMTAPAPTARQTLLDASAVTGSARGYGLAVQFASAWHGGTLAVVLLVLLVGTGTAGAAGNMGLGWLATLDRRRRGPAVNALLAQSMLLSGTLLVLARVDPTLPALRRLLLVVSASMNVGLSHEPVSITGPGLIAVAVCVLLGKLLPLAFLALSVAVDPPLPPEARASEERTLP